MPVPELFMHEMCDHHDFNYWIGCHERDRRKADYQMWEAAKKLARWNPLKQSAAMVYFLAVRAFGAVCFHYADKERDEHDLEQQITDLKKLDTIEKSGYWDTVSNGNSTGSNDKDD